MSIRIIIIILCAIIIGQMTSDIYLPSIPTMVDEFTATHNMLKLSLTVFLLGLVVTAFLCGPISDHIGRRKIILAGLLVNIFGTILCIFTISAEVFLCARFIQGLGIGCVGVVARGIFRDLFSGEKLIKIACVTGGVTSLTPVFAPSIGGHIHEIFGWQYNFILLFLLSLLVFSLLFRYLPETNKLLNKRDKFVTSTKNRFSSIISDKQFWAYSICSLIGFSAFITFIVMAPFIFQHGFAYSPKEQGNIMLSVAFGYTLGTILNYYLLEKIGKNQMLILGTIVHLLAATIMLVLAIVGFFNPYAVIYPMMLFVFGSGIINPVAAVGTLENYQESSGTVGALNSGSIKLGACFFSSLVAMIPIHTPLILAVMLLIYWFIGALAIRKIISS